MLDYIIDYMWAAALIIPLAIMFCFEQNNRIVITKYSLKNTNNGIRILLVSDLHSKQFGKDNKRLLKKIKEQSPDLIAFTGDLINDKGKKIDETLRFVSGLSKAAPVYYVPGNHEHRLDCFEELMEKIKNAGAAVLLDEIKSVQIKGRTINIAGLDENQASFKNYSERRKGNFKYKNYDAFFEEFCKKEGFRLVLSHYPENFAAIGENSYNKYDFELMLAGHAHGGQFILPLTGSVYSPGQGLFPKYASGIHGEKPKLTVSRGLGNSEFPLRLFNHPEIIIIDID